MNFRFQLSMKIGNEALRPTKQTSNFQGRWRMYYDIVASAW